MTEAEQLFHAAWDGDIATLTVLINAGVDLNAPYEAEHDSPLHAAVENLQLEAVRQLLEAGADIEQESDSGWTPLQHVIDAESDAAAQSGTAIEDASTAIVEVLLAAGAKPTNVGRFGQTPLDQALQWGNLKVAALLRTYSARCSQETEECVTRSH